MPNIRKEDVQPGDHVELRADHGVYSVKHDGLVVSVYNGRLLLRDCSTYFEEDKYEIWKYV